MTKICWDAGTDAGTVWQCRKMLEVWDSRLDSFATPGQMPGQFGSAIRWMQREMLGQVTSDRQTRTLMTIKSVLAELLFCRSYIS